MSGDEGRGLALVIDDVADRSLDAEMGTPTDQLLDP
jgi:hypothetical protein